MSDAIRLNINGEVVELSPRDMVDLRQLRDQAGYTTLLRIMESMVAGTRRELEDPTTDLEHVRALQGRLAVARDLRDLLEDGVERWYQAMRKEPADDDS